MEKITVLVTGVGGTLGLSILKALRLSSLPLKIIGTNFDPLTAGYYMADRAFTVADARSDPEKCLEQIITICREEKVNMVIPGTEAELLLLARHREEVEKESGSYLLVNPPELIETTLDKWKTVLFLRSRNLPAPRTALAANQEDLENLVRDCGFPLVVKPRSASGAQGLFFARTRRELEAAIVLVPDAIVQECLQPAEEEYTVGVFMENPESFTGAIIFRRKLVKGFTFRATVVKNAEIEKVVKKTALNLGASGPLNIQLKLTPRGPVIFEINPRISSSTVMRAHFGFNEPEMAIRRFLLDEKINPPAVKTGTALRYWEELYL